MTQENTQEELKNSLDQKKSNEKLNNPLDKIS